MGAVADTLHVAMHGPDGDIMDEHTALPWPALCAEVAKVRISLRASKLRELPRPLALAASAATSELLAPLLPVQEPSGTTSKGGGADAT